MLISGFFKVLILVGIIFFLSKHHGLHNFHRGGALQTLDERFAKGEINEEEYLSRKKVLNQR
ncbi:MAG TPA: SHOCT domain-containing protein [Clostridiaceae bacterium]